MLRIFTHIPVRRLTAPVFGCFLVAACSSAPQHPPVQSPAAVASQQQQANRSGPPRIVSAKRRLECVVYARGLSGIDLSGNAWTWWQSAAGKYARGNAPRVGAVIVLKRKGKSLGHLAVVTRIVNSREVIARHANWLNNGQIHLDSPIRDVSSANDWSAVKVWYTPGRVMGKSAYAAYGFIYPPRG